MSLRIPVFKPLLDASDLSAAQQALEMGWLGMGAYVGDFEKALHSYLALTDRHVVCVNTGHSALHLAMQLIGLAPGDEVITPSFNNVADFQAIIATGATPVFCDVRDDTLCIDTSLIESLITPRTKAIIVTDYDCCLAEHTHVSEIARRHNLRVVHDAAHSFGSFYDGRSVGSFSDITMFSFDPVKTITCIDGGALVVRTSEERDALHEMRLIGMCQPASVMYGNKRAWTYDVKRLGFRYHMANLHAAIGLSQLAKMPFISESRQRACELYTSLLSPSAFVRTPPHILKTVTPFLYYIRVPPRCRAALREYLTSHGIDTGIHWQPGHTFTLFKDCPRGDMTVTEHVGEEILSLPLHSGMSDDTIHYVARHINAFFAEERGSESRQASESCSAP